MIDCSGYKLPVAIPPGETLAEVLEDRNMTQAELAGRLGCTPKHINELIKGKASISSNMAVGLQYVLGMPASFWLNLEINYQEAKTRLDEAQLKKEVVLLKEIHYSEACNLGWLPRKTKDIEKVFESRRYLGLASLNSIKLLYPVSLRVTSCKSISHGALIMWLRQGEILASRQMTEAYDERKLRVALDYIRVASKEEADPLTTGIIGKLSECGVALVIVPHLKQTYATGAAIKLSKEKYAIEMSMRGAWADIFWFSLFHEIGHILLKHVKDGWSVDFNGNLSGCIIDQDKEDAANEFAKNQLIDYAEYSRFAEAGDFSKDAIRRFSKQNGIHTGILLGRLCHEGHLEFGMHQDLRYRIS
jgi:HTH-type transcriptional regulator/antitoxin HigA